MAREALRTFGMVMDNTSDIKNIVINNFFKSLDLGDNDLLNEFVLEKIVDFNFCIVQDKFISRIREIIDQEFKKIENSNQPIDYEQFEVNLKNGLQQITMDDIRLEDDIRTLSLQINDKFPMISRDYAFEKISSKQEMLKEVILSTNKSVIDTLVKMTPQLVQDLKQLEIENQNKNQVQQSSQNIETTKNTENIDNKVQQQNTSQKPINLHDLIQDIRKNIYSKSLSAISVIKSVNPFNEFKPITIEEFQIELEKYSVSVDSSYIKGIVSELNLELGRQLINKAKSNILRDIISSSNEIIDFINSEELMQKYGINIDDKYVSEIIEYVNNGINAENKKRSISIQSQQVITNNNISDDNVSKKEDIINLFEKYPGYKRLYECFDELANNDVQKDALEQIMKYGEYNGFKLNSMLSNEKDNENAEIERRIAFAEMILHDENLFFYLANNGLNVFHGTKIDALQTILSEGIFSSSELDKREIQLSTGEEQTMNKAFGGNIEKRSFISLTDDFDTSVSYAGFPYEEQTEYAKKYYGKELESDREIPIIVCLNGNNIEQQYSESLVTVKSTCNEIGINSSISPSDIKCIITSYDNIEYVKNLTSDYGIDVLGYNHNDKFAERLIADKEDKFYSILSHDVVINEEKFAKCKESIKEKMKKSKTNIPSTGGVSSVEKLNDDLSMKIASDVKMDIVFDLTVQYNSGISVVPITADALSAKYNMNERVAQQLASEVNEMVFGYIKSKEEHKKNYVPYVLDGFEEEKETTIKHR